MGDLLIDNKFIYNIELNFLYFMSYFMKLFFLLFMIGFLQDKPKELLFMNFCIKVILGIFLIYRFNNYRSNKISFTELDRKVIYSIGIYILLLSFTDIIINFITVIRNQILPYTRPIIERGKRIVKKYVDI